MKFILVTLIAIGLLVAAAFPQTPETLNLRPGKQVTSKKSKLKIKFIGVTEDSRCPQGANCIWAGRVVVKISVTAARNVTRIMEIDSSNGPQGEQFDGWAVALESITPAPAAGTSLDPKSYRAKVTVTRLQR